MGRPRFEATSDERSMVASMTAYGIPQASIVHGIKRLVIKTGELKPISVKTLRSAFKRELATGLDVANTKVADSIFKRACDLKHPQGAISAMFWMKCRGGWSEKQSLKLTGPDGGPIEFRLDLDDATPDELAVLERFLKKKAGETQPANDAEAA